MFSRKPKQQQPPPGYPVYVQYTPEDYARAMQKQKDNRNALGCLLFLGMVIACTAVMMIASRGF